MLDISIKRNIGKYRCILRIVPVWKLYGVNSHLSDGKHILMWDFDNMTDGQVKDSLSTIAQKWMLPKIYVLATGTSNHWIAYSFTRLPWLKATAIVALTKGVDPDFVKYSMFRDHFTLRISPKDMLEPNIAFTVTGPGIEESSIDDLVNFCQYQTPRN
jgi:hypothetical protein